MFKYLGLVAYTDTYIVYSL